MFGNKIFDDTFLRRKIADLELEIAKLKTHINSLRGLFNRKFEPGQAVEKKETSKSPDGLDELRDFYK